MKLIGLTGGIACGKSLAGMYLRELGAVVIDADKLARKVVEIATPGLSELRDAFGDVIMNPDGSLNRRALGAIAFADHERLAIVERITHPRIAEEFKSQLTIHEEQGEPYVVYENAIIVEKGNPNDYCALIVAYVAPDVQIARIMKRNNLNEQEARNRLAAQASSGPKLAIADYVVDTSGEKIETQRQVRAIWNDICRRL